MFNKSVGVFIFEKKIILTIDWFSLTSSLLNAFDLIKLGPFQSVHLSPYNIRTK